MKSSTRPALAPHLITPRPFAAKSFRLGRILATAFLASATSALAHPGHALRDAGVSHLLTSPDHLGVLGLAGGALWVLAWWVGRSSARRWLQLAGGSVLVLAGLLWLAGS